MDLNEYKKCLDQIDPQLLEKLKTVINHHDKIIILGNGGSNAISCHMAEDYTKMLDKRVLCFGDSARLSCYANDYGWEDAYMMFVKHFADPDTLVILISSSGNSPNILKAAEYCINKHQIITMSGFSDQNKLKKNFGDSSLIHFWVNSNDYGIVESLHEVILHSVL